MPTSRQGPFIGAIGNKIYVAGGATPSGILNVTEVYDPVTDTWSTAAPMPVGRTTGASAVVNDILYTIGGGVTGGGNSVNTVQAYDPATDTWTTKAPVPTPINSTYAVVQNGLIYVVSGFNNNARLTTLLVYDPSANTWKNLAPMKVGKSQPAVALFGNTIIAAGGLSTNNTNGTVDNEAYNIASNSWTTLAPSPIARFGGCFEAAGGTLFIAGGRTSTSAPILDTMDSYDVTANSWTTGLPPMPTGVSNPGAVSIGGRLYCIGGTTVGQLSGAVVGDVQIFQPDLPSAISPGGVITASIFGSSTSIAPGSWMEIHGINLASNSRGWTSADFNGYSAPASLDGTSVTVGGQAAFISYISPTQINAQAPSGIATGQQQVVVTSPLGIGAPYTVTVNPTQPALSAPASLAAGGLQYVMAIFADTRLPVFTPGDFVSSFSPRARPGDTIVLYGTGFGPVTPDSPAGQIVQQDNTLVSPLQVSFNGNPGSVVSAGLVPGNIGLYQVTVTIPGLDPGDAVPLSLNLGGTAGTQTLYIAIGN